MGKLKKGRRNQRARHNPAARKNGNGNSAENRPAKDETVRQNKIVPLISKLASAAPNDRSMALSAITVLAEDERLRRMFLKERLVATVMEQSLTDSNDEIVVEAFGLLRNLTIEEGHEVAKHLWRANIWAAVERGLAKIRELFGFITENKKLDKKRAYLLYDFTENLLSLVVAIASCSDELYGHVRSRVGSMVQLVVDLLNWNIPNLRTTTKLFNALLDFVFEFASDSADFIHELGQHADFSLPALQAAIDTPAHQKNVLGQALVQGIQFHFFEVKRHSAAEKESFCSETLRKIFGAVTNVDIKNLKDQLAAPDNAQAPVSKQPAESEKPQDIDMPFGGDTPEKTQAKADLQAIDVVIDLFTTICEYLAINDTTDSGPVALGDEIVNILLNVAYPALLHLLTFDQENAEVLQLTLKVLIAFNNLCWLFLSSETIPVAWFEHIPQLWDALEKVSHTENLENLRLCLSVFWALSKSVGPEIRDKITGDSVGSILAKSTQIQSQLAEAEDPLLSLEFILSAAGFLGTIAQVIGNVEITKNISEFLLGQIAHYSKEENNSQEPKAIEIALEGLNSIYDIFGDAEYDYDYPIFVEGNYIAKLGELEPSVKACYKKIDKNKNPELKLKAEEAWTNLNRFIDYKKSERS